MSQIAVMTAKVKVYTWTCDQCGKTLRDQSEGRLISNRHVHLGMHLAREEKERLKIGKRSVDAPLPPSASTRPIGVVKLGTRSNKSHR